MEREKQEGDDKKKGPGNEGEGENREGGGWQQKETRRGTGEELSQGKEGGLRNMERQE